MRNWIEFVKRHHDIEVIDEKTIKIANVGYDKNRRFIDHIITEDDKGYTVKEYYHDTGAPCGTFHENSIKAYLGY